MITLTAPFPSPYHRAHAWQAGDRIVRVDGREVEDILDLYYYVPDGGSMRLTIARDDGSEREVVLPPASLDVIRAAFAPLEFKRCACACVFCFVDQNPPGMRDSIYVKDEDYRFSFLYGNYVTLTSLGRKGLRRVIDQRMSPLYVSVHATDAGVRARLLGIGRRLDVVEALRSLVENGIEVHTQVVLCPGWNDGEVLERTFRDLLALAPLAAAARDEPAASTAPAATAEPAARTAPAAAAGQAASGAGARPGPGGEEIVPDDADLPGEEGGVRSLAVVPVGLTAHRDGLTRLAPVTPEIAREVVARVRGWQEEATAAAGLPFVHLSDEFYLLAGEPFPPAERYDEFPQLDNGVGLTVQLRETWREDLARLVAEGRAPRVPLTVLTGVLAAEAFARELVPALAAAGVPSVEVVPVENTLFGTPVTVAGLLSGADLRRALLALPAEPRRTVALPARVFNSDGLTLDDLTVEQIAAGTPHRVVVPPDEGFVDFWAELP
ncbi:MAG: DUF512 domain-containing protein [Candidatus Krumholzibacteriia bacterium]